MTKRLLLICLLAPCMAWAQNHQTDTVTTTKSIIPLDKQGLLKDVDMIINGKFSANYQARGEDANNKSFRMDQFRMDITGNITPDIYFRMRQRFTPGYGTGPTDNVDSQLDAAFLTMKMSDKWSITAGRYFTLYGGYEIDANTIHVYQFSDIPSYIDSYTVGAAATYEPNKDHSITFQLGNPRTESFNDIYGAYSRSLDDGMVASKTPFFSSIYYRANLIGEKLQTISALSFLREHGGDFTTTGIIGLQARPFKRFQIQLDLSYSNEQLDTKRIVSDLVTTGLAGDTDPDDFDFITNGAFQRIARNTEYASVRTRMDYRLSQRFNLFFEGFVDQANWKDVDQFFENSNKKLRMGYGYTPGIEIIPLKKQPLTLFLAYKGHNYEYSQFSKTALNQKNKSTGLITFGLFTRFAVM